MGVIDTLSAGLDLVRRRPWLILLPVILDVGLWVAPKLSIAAMMHRVLTLAMAQLSGYPEVAESLRGQFELAEEMAKSVNLGAFLSSGYLGIPTLGVANSTSFFGRPSLVIEVQSALALLGLVAGLSLAGLLVGTLYLAPIAAVVRDDEVDWRALVRRLPQYWRRLLGASLVIAGAVLFLGLPMALTLGLFGFFGQGVAVLTAWFAILALLWIMVYLAFVPQAILCGGDGVLQAVAHSINVVRMSFWPTVGLLLLINVITGGLGFIWDRLAMSAPGALAAIVANAYVGTGLAAAIFIFYRDRLRALQQAIGQLRSRV